MANVTVNASVSNINVSTTTSNITVTESGTFIANIAVQESNVVVGVVDNIINVAEVAAVSTQDIRAALGNTAPILYDTNTGIFSIDEAALFSGKTTDDLAEGNTNLYYTNARVDARVPTSIVNGNITLQRYQDTVVNDGTVSGNITINAATGAVHTATLNGNITGISIANLSVGTSLLLILTQDIVGLNYLDLTTYTSNWTNWNFVNNDSAFNAAPNAINYIGIVFDGVKYHASVLTNAGTGTIQNGQLANSNVIVNGTTISLGSSGNISHLGNLTTSALPEGSRLYFTPQRVYGNITAASPITFNNVTGQIGLSTSANYSTTGNITGGYFIGNGALLTGITPSNILTNAQVVSYIATQPLTVGGNLTVTGDATISGNDITVANVSATRITPIGANLFVANVIDIPTSGLYPIIINKPTNFNYSVEIAQGITLSGDIISDAGGNINTTYGSIYSTQGGDIYSTNMGSSPTGRSGNIYTLTGNIIGAYLHGDGSNITGISTLTNAQVLSYIATQPLTVGGNLTVNGNINATGNINYQNVTDLYVTDQKITLNSNAATNANVEIISNRPTATNTMLKWNEQSTRWEFTNNGSTYYPIATSTTDLAEGANLYYTVGRANTAIDNRVTKSFVEGLGVSYTSLTDKPTIPTHTSNLVNDSGFITAATANVISVNGKTGTVTLSTTDISEGANLYFTNARANAAFTDSLDNIATSIVSSANITTSANVQGQYILGNGAFLTGIASAYGNSNVTTLLSNLGSNAISSTANITTTANVQANYFIGNFIGNLISTSTNVDVDLDFGTFTSNTDVQVAIDFGTF